MIYLLTTCATCGFVWSTSKLAQECERIRKFMNLTENDIRKLPIRDKDSIERIKEIVFHAYSVTISDATAEKIRCRRMRSVTTCRQCDNWTSDEWGICEDCRKEGFVHVREPKDNVMTYIEAKEVLAAWKNLT